MINISLQLRYLNPFYLLHHIEDCLMVTAVHTDGFHLNRIRNVHCRLGRVGVAARSPLTHVQLCVMLSKYDVFNFK